jgi:hypothetical protein
MPMGCSEALLISSETSNAIEIAGLLGMEAAGFESA